MMSEGALWALLPDMAEDVLRSLADREAADRAAFAAKYGPKAFFVANEGTSQTAPYAIENGVAIIGVSGPIDRKARISFWTGLPYTAGQDAIRGAIETALADRDVGAILLSIDSPGGVVSGTKELADYIAGIRGQKPIAAYADGLCASAAFWLAAATGQIYAPKTAQVGSIGVIAVLTDWTRAADRAGITRTVIHSGKWKAAGSPDKALTDEERAHFQARLEALHQIFVSDILTHLNISPQDSSNTIPPWWAEGQTFLGDEALALGLVSQITGDRTEAVSALAAKIQNGEEFMNLQELKASHPELVKELAAELAAGSEKALAEKAAAAQKETLELVSALGGNDLAEKARTLLAANITSAQLRLLAPMLAKPETAETAGRDDGEARAREEALEAIKSATGAPVPAAGAQPKPNALLADAERRASQAGRI